jgi:hypothetical protein
VIKVLLTVASPDCNRRLHDWALPKGFDIVRQVIGVLVQAIRKALLELLRLRVPITVDSVAFRLFPEGPYAPSAARGGGGGGGGGGGEEKTMSYVFYTPIGAGEV